MRYSSVSSALVGLYNWSRQCEVKAMNYQTIFGVRSTLPKDTIQELIAQSRILIKKIEGLCNPKQLAILEYRYGYKDRFDNPFCLINIGEVAFPGDFRIGMLIAKYWRDDDVVVHDISKMCNVQIRQAYNKIDSGKERLELNRLDFISDKCELYCQIEELLLNNNLLKL